MPAISPVARALASGEPVPRAGADACSTCCRRARRGELLGVLGPRARRRPAAARPRPDPRPAHAVLPRRARPSSDEDLATAQDVADRAGLALDNARLYSAQQQLAEGLQRSLLTEPPQPDHGEIAVRYLPAAEAARVGGDWYDAFLQPGGATMLVIGDVVGHDTEAAAAMGQLRGLLRGIATYSDAGPAEVLRGLDTSMTTLQTRTLATAAVARFEQTPDELRAGHHPHALGQRRPPAAAGGQPRRQRRRARVVEGRPAAGRRRRDAAGGSRWSRSTAARPSCSTPTGSSSAATPTSTPGMVRLRDALIELADLPLEELLDELLERLVARPPGGRRRAGRRPAAPAGPAAAGGGRAERRPAERAGPSGPA